MIKKGIEFIDMQNVEKVNICIDETDFEYKDFVDKRLIDNYYTVNNHILHD